MRQRHGWLVISLVSHGAVWHWLPKPLGRLVGPWAFVDGPGLILGYGASLLPVVVLSVLGVVAFHEAALRPRYLVLRLLLAIPMCLLWLSMGVLAIAGAA